MDAVRTDEGPWLSEEQQEVWRRWLRLNARLPAALHRQLQTDAGLSLPDFEVLVRLSESPDSMLRVTELAKVTYWERSRVSHQVSRMERRGLVERTTCASDARGSYVVLTARGRQALEQAAPGHARTVRGLLYDGLSSAQLHTLRTALDSALERLEESPLVPEGGPPVSVPAETA